MVCKKCGKEIENNEQELCEKCLEEQNNEQESKIVQKPTGLRASIIGAVSATVGVLCSILILPGLIFGVLGFVESLLAMIDAIRNRNNTKNKVPLILGIIGLVLSLFAVAVAFVLIVIIIIFIATGEASNLLVKILY